MKKNAAVWIVEIWFEERPMSNMLACRCDGSGVYVTCFDDICQAIGECMHGDDGMAECPCGGEEADDMADEVTR